MINQSRLTLCDFIARKFIIQSHVQCTCKSSYPIKFKLLKKSVAGPLSKAFSKSSSTTSICYPLSSDLLHIQLSDCRNLVDNFVTF